ncbi:DUF7064 domain-containing protein [Parageobacillus thermoglucosidasius]|uniref:DUF7064 domain-containing protein n=1 Tax=Parageobacillus thermoglucosidasius TaxID=1426 RepID=UPI000B57F3DB|nr:hypothetical protein [Parageobacillus thermoglucosidasius]OUM92061.1 MAG: hypothetical protein BAA00_07115 [Parageobacillus thermoglucosidasius]
MKPSVPIALDTALQEVKDMLKAETDSRKRINLISLITVLTVIRRDWDTAAASRVDDIECLTDIMKRGVKLVPDPLRQKLSEVIIQAEQNRVDLRISALDATIESLEGPASVKGSINLRGTKTDIVNGYCVRDISWGIRDWEKMLHYRLSWPYFTNGKVVAITHAIFENDINNYQMAVYDGNQWLQIHDLEDNIEFAEDGMTVKSLHYRFRDGNNKIWEYTAKPIFNYMIPVDGFRTSMNWMEYRLNDGTVGYGTCECGFRLPLERTF